MSHESMIGPSRRQADDQSYCSNPWSDVLHFALEALLPFRHVRGRPSLIECGWGGFGEKRNPFPQEKRISKTPSPQGEKNPKAPSQATLPVNPSTPYSPKFCQNTLLHWKLLYFHNNLALFSGLSCPFFRPIQGPFPAQLKVRGQPACHAFSENSGPRGILNYIGRSTFPKFPHSEPPKMSVLPQQPILSTKCTFCKASV